MYKTFILGSILKQG